MAVVTINGKAYVVEAGTKLGELLARERPGGSVMLSMPCGGHGRCGKCKVVASGHLSSLSDAERRFLSEAEREEGVRLACSVTVEGDCQVRLLGDGLSKTAGQIRTTGAMGDTLLQPTFASYGFALDIGTTTLAARLYDVHGALLAEGSCLNPQAGWGADVISRIEADLRGEGRNLTQAICGAVDRLMEEMAERAGVEAREIDGLVITGNTVMLHLLTGTSTEPLSHAPFAAKRLFGESVTAGELGLQGVLPDTEVYLAPCVSAFVGADLITALLAGGLCEDTRTQLLVDIGTNGEMALWHEGQLHCCSTAAGPAFEGAGISMGMGGSSGAVDRVAVQDGKLTAHVIGDAAPVGICGSGVVDAVACLLETGRMDDTGYLEEGTAMLLEPVSLSQNDIRMVQLAKSAIHGGIRTLLHSAGLECRDVSALLVAGGFGSFLNVENAAKIGLFPQEMLPCVKVVGNAALGGASMLLLNEGCLAVCQGYAKRARVVELSANPYFAEEYMERMLF